LDFSETKQDFGSDIGRSCEESIAEYSFVGAKYRYHFFVMTRIFLSHASEDKGFVKSLAEELRKQYKVWYDEFELTVGDSLLQKINEGLSSCDYGVVVLSPVFFKKKWPQAELDGLFAVENSTRKVILPVWKDLTAEDVRRFSPILAGRLGVSTSDGIDKVVMELRRAISVSENVSSCPDQRPAQQVKTFDTRQNPPVRFERITLPNVSRIGTVSSAPPRGTNPFKVDCARYFTFEAEPAFDITLINHSEKPALLTSLGVKVLSVALVSFVGGIPEPFTVRVSQCVVVRMPDIREKIENRCRLLHLSGVEKAGFLGPHILEIAPQPVNQLVSVEIPDPIYLDVNTAYRFVLILDSYRQRMLNYAILKVFVGTNVGNSLSDPIWVSVSGDGRFDYESILNAKNIDALSPLEPRGEEPGISENQFSQLAELQQAGKHDDTISLLTQILHTAESYYGSEHEVIAGLVNRIGVPLWQKKSYKEAASFFRRALTMRVKLLGEQHPDVANSLSNLASSLREQQEYAESEHLYKRAISILENAGEEYKNNLADVLGYYAKLLGRISRHKEAEALVHRAEGLRTKH
jgi:tetratricopeptide (TPR) repeat protein